MSYTINGEDSPPFSIGIYGSPDGLQPTTLLQTYDVDDPSLLAGGGQNYTATFPASLDNIDSSQYVVAQLDSTTQVEETSKADNISAPLSGVFEQADGHARRVGKREFPDQRQHRAHARPGDRQRHRQHGGRGGDPLTSNTFSGVTSVIISTPGGNNTVNVDPSVTVPVSAFAGPGSSVTGTVAATDATPTISNVYIESTIDKGGIATLTADVGNLAGIGLYA